MLNCIMTATFILAMVMRGVGGNAIYLYNPRICNGSFFKFKPTPAHKNVFQESFEFHKCFFLFLKKVPVWHLGQSVPAAKVNLL